MNLMRRLAGAIRPAVPCTARLTHMLVVVAPGQGAQSPGFLVPWLELEGVRERLDWLSAVSGIDLIAHGTTSRSADC